MARSRGTQGGSTRGRSLHAAAIRRALRSGGRRHIAHCQGAFDARATPLYPAVGDGDLRSEITLPNLQDHPVPVSAVGGCTKISSLPLNLQRNPDSTGSSWRAPPSLGKSCWLTASLALFEVIVSRLGGEARTKVALHAVVTTALERPSAETTRALIGGLRLENLYCRLDPWGFSEYSRRREPFSPTYQHPLGS
jgi:hypothetical protein